MTNKNFSLGTKLDQLVAKWLLRKKINLEGCREWVLIRGWAIIEFSPFSASGKFILCNKTLNNNKTWSLGKSFSST